MNFNELLQSECKQIDFLKYWLAQFEFWESKERQTDCSLSIEECNKKIEEFI